MKKEIWEATDAQIDAWLAEYGVPAAGCEWAKPGDLHPDHRPPPGRGQPAQERRRAHPGRLHRDPRPAHGAAPMDTLFVSMICEGVRRFTAKRGAPVNLALPPLMYGGHPYHHLGMPGTVIMREESGRGAPDRRDARAVERRLPQADHTSTTTATCGCWRRPCRSSASGTSSRASTG